MSPYAKHSPEGAVIFHTGVRGLAAILKTVMFFTVCRTKSTKLTDIMLLETVRHQGNDLHSVTLASCKR